MFIRLEFFYLFLLEFDQKCLSKFIIFNFPLCLVSLLNWNKSRWIEWWPWTSVKSLAKDMHSLIISKNVSWSPKTRYINKRFCHRNWVLLDFEVQNLAIKRAYLVIDLITQTSTIVVYIICKCGKWNMKFLKYRVIFNVKNF